MPYTSRHAGKLTDEERDVAAALVNYSTAAATGFDWTPTAALWQAYLDWLARHRWRFDPDAPARLTRRQFGHAVRRVLPGVQRRKRSSAGRPQWGFARLTGPLSIVTPPRRGGVGRRASLATALAAT